MKGDDFLNRLRDEGKLVSRGGFELERQKAREKLQDYQLPDPCQYVVCLVEAGHLLGTALIHVRVDADEMEMEFDGVGLSKGELEGVYDAVFSDRTDRRTRALRQLAIGLNAARPLDPSVARVSSYVNGELATLEITSDGEQITDEISQQQHMASLAFTNIYLRGRRRLGFATEFSQTVHGQETALRERCRYSERSVFLEGDRLSYGLTLDSGLFKKVRFATSHERGVIGVHPGEDDIVIDLVQNGVKISEHRPASETLGLRGAVLVNKLTRDLSQRDFVEDEHWDQLTESIIPAAAFASALLYVRELSVPEQDKHHPQLVQMAEAVGPHGASLEVTTVARNEENHRVQDLLDAIL